MKKFAGLLSIGLIGAAIVFDLVLLFRHSVVLGGVYISMVIIGAFIILMNYCRKCPHSMNESCHHIVPGKIAKKLPYKKTGKYTILELALVIVSVGAIFIYPVLYLYKQVIFLAIYLLLWLSGIILLRKGVCTSCYNRWCIACPNRVK